LSEKSRPPPKVLHSQIGYIQINYPGLRPALLIFGNILYMGKKKAHITVSLFNRHLVINNLPILLAYFSSCFVKNPRRCYASPPIFALPEKKLASQNLVRLLSPTP